MALKLVGKNFFGKEVTSDLTLCAALSQHVFNRGYRVEVRSIE